MYALRLVRIAIQSTFGKMLILSIDGQIAGSGYSYAYVMAGEMMAFIVGWALVISYIFTVATVARGWTGYLDVLLRSFKSFTWSLPLWLYNWAPGVLSMVGFHVEHSSIIIGCICVYIVVDDIMRRAHSIEEDMNTKAVLSNGHC